MTEDKELDSGVFIGEHRPCIKCSSSDALACYEHDSDDGTVWYDAYCYSCATVFSREEVEGSEIASSLGYEGDVVKVEDKKPFKLQKKCPPMTREEVVDFINSHEYASDNYRGVDDEYSQFFGHLVSKDASGGVTARYYPETKDGIVTGYKCRNHPKDFRYGKVGMTGGGSDLSGQVKYTTGGKYLLIVGGEEDKAAAYQMLSEGQKARGQGEYSAIAVVSSTVGEGAAHKQVALQYEFCDMFDNIIIGMDNDEAGREAARKVSEVLPKDKVKTVLWSNKDPNKMLQMNMSKQFVRDFYTAKPLVQDIIQTSHNIAGQIRETLTKPRVTLPDYMKVLQEKMGGGVRQGTIVNIIGDTSVGKCHGKDTPVMMYDGSIKMVQEVVQGEQLMGADGSPRQVLSTVSGRDTMYRIRQVNGMDYVVNSAHILSLRAGYDCKGSGVLKGDVVNINVEDYIKSGSKLKRSLKGYKGDLTELGASSTVTLDPHIFGLWLADGTALKPQITFNKADEELITAFREFIAVNGYKETVSPSNDREGCIGIDAIGGFRTSLSTLNVIGNKHIPKEFLHASYKDRIELLSGLLDGDGYMTSGGYEIVQKSLALSQDIIFLAKSLGLSASVRSKFSKCQGFAGAMYQRIFIYGETDKLNLRLTRKRVSNKSELRRKVNTAISVDFLGTDDYYGFSLDGDHLYCLGDFTVTHNTTHINGLFYHLIFNSPEKPAVISLEATAGEYALDMLSLHLEKNLVRMDEALVLDYLDSPEIKELSEDLWTDEYGEERFVLLDERDGDIKSLERQMERMSSQYGCRVFVIDVLTDILRGTSSDMQEDHMGFQKRFSKKGNTIFNVLHTRKPPTDKDGKTRAITEYDALGSSTFVQSAAVNILIERDKMTEDDTDKNTTIVRMPKCRGGVTGDAGMWFYEAETRKVFDKKDYFGQ